MASNATPHHRIHVGRAEIGAAWSMRSEEDAHSLAQARRSLVQRADLREPVRRRRWRRTIRSRVAAVKNRLRRASPTAPLGSNGRGSAKTVKRVHAVAANGNCAEASEDLTPSQARALRSATWREPHDSQRWRPGRRKRPRSPHARSTTASLRRRFDREPASMRRRQCQRAAHRRRRRRY